MTHQKQMQELETMLRNYDWYYHFSDDGAVYRAGIAKTAELNAKVKSLGNDGKRLYQAFYDIQFSPARGFEYDY
jgi:hypothetical protein